MYPSLLLAGLLSLSVAQAQNGTSVFPTEGYGMERYARLLSGSPFDFVPPQKPAEDPPPVMQDWALAGLTKATDYTVVNLVNLKTQERLRLTQFPSPETKADATKSGTDTYRLEELAFSSKQPASLQNAIVQVSKNGILGTVKFDPKVFQLKPLQPAQAVNPAAPAQITLKVR